MYSFQNNNRGGFIPLIIGGVIGYGIGANQRPNYYPMYGPIPVYQVRPPYYYYPPIYRKR